MAGQLIPRGERTWLIRVFLGRDATGTRKYLSETFHGTKAEAEKVLRERLRQRDTGVEIGKGRQTLDVYLDRWLEDVKGRVRFRTHEDYAALLKRHVRPAIGMRPLGKVSPLEIQGVYTGMTAKGFSARSVKHLHCALFSALRQAVAWREIAFNPADAVTLPQQERGEVAVFSSEEVRTLLVKARGAREAHLFTVLVATGVRPSEAFALRWADLSGNTLAIRRSLSRRGKTWKIHEGGKRKRSTRTIHLAPLAVEAFASQKKQQAAERLQAGPAWNDMGLIFPDGYGQPEREHTVLDRFQRVLVAAGLPKRRLYDLRHTWATNILAAGGNPKMVSEQLGHASVAFTLDTYAHVLPNMQEEAAASTDRLFRPAGTP